MKANRGVSGLTTNTSSQNPSKRKHQKIEEQGTLIPDDPGYERVLESSSSTVPLPYFGGFGFVDPLVWGPYTAVEPF